MLKYLLEKLALHSYFFDVFDVKLLSTQDLSISIVSVHLLLVFFARLARGK